MVAAIAAGTAGTAIAVTAARSTGTAIATGALGSNGIETHAAGAAIARSGDRAGLSGGTGFSTRTAGSASDTTGTDSARITADTASTAIRCQR